MLKVENLTYGPPQSPPLQEGLNFSVLPGEILHIAGDNGTGKSLLTRAILGLYPVNSGEIKNSFATTRYLPQMQNRATHLPYSLADIIGDSKKELGLLDKNRMLLPWNKASGGERQRALLNRFFLQSGELMVLDEPFNHLDAESRERVRQLLAEEMKAHPTYGTILISHENDPRSWLEGLSVKTLELARLL